MVSAKQAIPKQKKAHQLIKIEKKNKEKPVTEKLKKHLVSVEKQVKKKPQSTIKEVEKKKVKYVMPSKYITEELVSKSLAALEQVAAHQMKKKNAIFEDETPILVELNCIKIQNAKGNIRFVLPHSTVASTGEVCLVTPDLKKGKKIDHEPTVDHWEELLKNADVTAVKTVLPMRQLRVEYDQYELQRRLLTQHDFMMVDTRVLSHVSHILGQMFFKKHNMLVPVRLNETSLKKDIDIGLRTTMLRLSEGTTSTILVGHTGMKKKRVKANVLSLIQQLRQKYPGGEANIRSICLKLPLSLSLPLYVTLRPSKTVGVPKLKHQKPKHYTVVEDELSTIPGSTVRVAPDGTVHLKKNKVVRDVEESDKEQESNAEEESSQEE